MSPLCETYISPAQANHMEPFYPLHVRVCGSCFLAQIEQYVTAEELFGEYAYFSSYSDSWLAHARHYVDLAIARFGLDASSMVMELGSNDGYLLQYFAGKGIRPIGVEPAANVAAVATGKGIRTVVAFFGRAAAAAIASEHGEADLLIANNVLAQVPDLHDFVGAMKAVLAPHGVITIEFPHLLRLMNGNQFDTIYHEHFSYFSLKSVENLFARHGLTVFDVEELPTHGGSLRIYVRHYSEDSEHGRPQQGSVIEMRRKESEAGLDRIEPYSRFAEQVKETKRSLLSFLVDTKRAGHSIVGYGAPGKGNTLLNYCGIRTDFLDYTVDRNPYKQGKLLPGTRIPILHPDTIFDTRPDYVMILPWNLKDEIIAQLSGVRDWGARFIVPIPEVTVC